MKYMGEKMKKEIDVQKIIEEYYLYSQQAEVLKQNLDLINASLVELGTVRETLEQIEKLEEGHELLIPIGANSYIKAKIANKNDVLVGIGAKVVVRKSIEKAKKDVEEKIENIKKVRDEQEKKLNDIMSRLEEIAPIVQQIIAVQQQQQIQQSKK